MGHGDGMSETTSTGSTSTRRPRTDAQRNRTHILDVAARHFAEHGVEGSMDAIPKRAGVGPGTLYRHFPNRDALLAALPQARDEELVARREAVRCVRSPRSLDRAPASAIVRSR